MSSTHTHKQERDISYSFYFLFTHTFSFVLLYRYTVGALENGRLAKSVFPGWTVRMYHDETVPAEILSELRALDVELVKQNDIHGGIAGMFWRFLPASDPTVARYIVRDTDSRLSPRERHAVEEWIKSKKPIHSIRDHPNHDRGLNGGMWGGTRDAVPDMDRLVRAWSSRGHYGADLDFLNQRVWPSVVAKSYSSDSYTCHKWPNSHPFPTRRNDDFEHVRLCCCCYSISRVDDLPEFSHFSKCISSGWPSFLRR